MTGDGETGAVAAPPITWRRLKRTDAPELETAEAGASDPGRASLLFVHGASAGAWMWAERFLPLFAEAGRHAVALSLRGHGGSGGGSSVQASGLDAFGDDLAFAVARFARPPIVVAHSLGGLLAQRLVGRVPMGGLVLLASLPPEGMAFVSPRLVWSEPQLWVEALMSALAPQPLPLLAATRGLMEGEGFCAGAARLYAGRMTPESPRALLEAHMPAPVLPAAAAGLSTLVLGGGRDSLVWLAEAWRTACYHGAAFESVARGGHFLQLGAAAPEAAARILRWLDARRL